VRTAKRAELMMNEVLTMNASLDESISGTWSVVLPGLVGLFSVGLELVLLPVKLFSGLSVTILSIGFLDESGDGVGVGSGVLTGVGAVTGSFLVSDFPELSFDLSLL